MPNAIKNACRQLRRTPWRSAAILGTLSLAIGMATTMVAVVDALLVRPVPFPNAHELAVLSLRNGLLGSGAASQPMFSAWKNLENLGAVEGAVADRTLVETEGGGAAATVARVSPGLLTLLGGVHPIAGRLFLSNESSGRILISETLWESTFARRVDIIGQAVRIDGERLEVVGVLPATFRFPSRSTTIWRVTDFADPQTTQRPIVYVRLAADARRQLALEVATEAARRAAPQYSEKWRAEAEPLADYLGDRYYRRAVPLLAGGVALLCIVLATNAAGLMLLAVLGRRREIAICHALGASRRRMLVDFASETLLISIASIAGGLFISVWLVELCRTTLDAASLMRGLNTVTLDSRSITMAFAFGFATSAIVGLSTWFAARIDGKASDFIQLRVSGAVGIAGGPATRAREALVLAQVSLVTFLGFTALLLVRSFVTLSAIEPGFDPSGMQVAHVGFPAAAFPTEELRLQAARSLRTEAETIPGVRGATWSYGTPPGGGITDTGLWTPLDSANPSREFSAHRFYVEPDFFAVYDLKLAAGRAFLSSDSAMATVISERLAASLWPGEDPVGRRFLFEGAEKTVIGVVKEVRWPTLGELKDVPQYYQRLVFPGAMLTMACAGPCPSETLIRQRLHSASRGARVGSIHQPSALYRQELAKPVAMATFGLAISVVAICAGAAGLFSLLAQFVAVRRREFAIRACLGAPRGALRSIVWRQALVVVAPGLLLGALGAQWSSRALTGLVTSEGSAITLWAAIASIVAMLVVCAAWAPLRAASRIAPIELLREP